MVEPAYNDNVVGVFISARLDDLEWTQRHLAQALGVRPQTVNKWVSGENVPAMSRWDSIEQALGVEQGRLYALVMSGEAAKQRVAREKKHTEVQAEPEAVSEDDEFRELVTRRLDSLEDALRALADEVRDRRQPAKRRARSAGQ